MPSPTIPHYVILPSPTMSFRGAAEESKMPAQNPSQTRSPQNLKSFEGVRGNFYKSSPAVSYPKTNFHNFRKLVL